MAVRSVSGRLMPRATEMAKIIRESWSPCPGKRDPQAYAERAIAHSRGLLRGC